jgi:hypothetical protein
MEKSNENNTGLDYKIDNNVRIENGIVVICEVYIPYLDPIKFIDSYNFTKQL